MRRVLCFGVCVWVCLMSAGCANPWRVLYQVRPNPYGRDPQFFLMPIRYTKKLGVGHITERQFLRRQNAIDRRRWHRMKRMVVQVFQRTFLNTSQRLRIEYRGRPQPIDFLILPSIEYIYPGFRGLLTVPSEVRLRLRIARGKDLIDEVLFRSRTDSRGRVYLARGGRMMQVSGTLRGRPYARGTMFERLRSDASNLGRWVASFLRHRLRSK